jgi:probable rRNA maturation factor
MSGLMPAISVEVTIATEGWSGACPDAERLVSATAELAFDQVQRSLSLPASAGATLDITLTDDAEQQQLNRLWRGKDAPTNVLAFPAADADQPPPLGAPLLLGDVVLAFETVAREAAEQNKPIGNHLRHLVVHGVLHLLGFDHQADADANAMETQEIEILARLGVPDPYRDTI